MPRGEESSDTSRQKRRAEHIEVSRREEPRSAEPEPDPIAADVHEAYRESDLPASVARERAADAEEKAERSGQAEESPAEDEKGTGALED